VQARSAEQALPVEQSGAQNVSPASCAQSDAEAQLASLTQGTQAAAGAPPAPPELAEEGALDSPAQPVNASAARGASRRILICAFLAFSSGRDTALKRFQCQARSGGVRDDLRDIPRENSDIKSERRRPRAAPDKLPAPGYNNHARRARRRALTDNHARSRERSWPFR
jgi:hypothetical protein